MPFLGGGQSGVPAEKLRLLAKIASNRYLSDKVPLTGSLQKIADENGLNTHQVARVAEMANHETHAALWASEPDKTKVAFAVADPSKVSVKEAPRESRPSTERSVPRRDRGPSTSEMFGVNPQNVHNGLTDVPEKKQIIVIIEKRAAAKRGIEDDLIKTTMLHEHEEKNLGRLVKQAYLGDGIKLDQLYAAACAEGLGDVAGEYFPKIAAQLQMELGRAELTKLAWKAPEELIDYDVPLTIVNGAHPVMISLDALLKYRDDVMTFNGRMSRINDEVTILGERLRELE
jgi:hypothetical protein